VKTYADPGVFEGLVGSDSLGWVNGQHLVDQVFCLWSHCVPLRGWELGQMKKVGVTVGKEGRGIGNNTHFLQDLLGVCIFLANPQHLGIKSRVYLSTLCR